MSLEDKIIVCDECAQEFAHTVEDQERYASRGFTNDPKRCRACRNKRKAEEKDLSGDGKTLECIDCGTEFLFSAKDQAYYAERGFTNEPKRCRECREKRKERARASRRGGGGGGGGGRGGPGGRDHGRGSFGGGRGRPRPGGDRGPRENFDAVCAECGVKTTVPFKPVEGRPVYCRDCFRGKRR